MRYALTDATKLYLFGKEIGITIFPNYNRVRARTITQKNVTPAQSGINSIKMLPKNGESHPQFCGIL